MLGISQLNQVVYLLYNSPLYVKRDSTHPFVSVIVAWMGNYKLISSLSFCLFLIVVLWK